MTSQSYLYALWQAAAKALANGLKPKKANPKKAAKDKSKTGGAGAKANPDAGATAEQEKTS